MAHRVLVLTSALALLGACGGSSPAPSSSAQRGAGGEQPAAPPESPEEGRAVSGTIVRSDLEPILEGGLGRFLQGVETEPHVADGEFVGFRLTRLYPDDERFAALDIGPGDTVVRVNGQPIERPEQALQVWNSLRVASELMIEYLRDGETRELRFEIVD